MLTTGWRFRFGEMPAGVERPDYSDADWEAVEVPHTWNRVGYYITETPGRVNTPENINRSQGVGWYRLSFTAAPSLRGKRVWLQFDAASRTAEVWLNGVFLGQHAGGFSRFRLDASGVIKPGESNLLVVKTDNSNPLSVSRKSEGQTGAGPVRSPTADVLPLAGDFFVHGGLYRPVSLIATNPIHMEMLDYGGPGVYAATRSIDGGQATVDVRSGVRNDSESSAVLDVEARMVDAGGRTVAKTSSRVVLSPGESTSVAQSLEIKEVRLWHGVSDPYLYRLVVEIFNSDKKVEDRVDQAFGVRQMRFDPETGFFLNGKPYRIHGVGLHQDVEGKGWAQSEADIEADVALIREMGANSLRLTHYQHGQTVHELANRHGLILWDEIPLVTVWTIGRDQKEPTPELMENMRQQLRELIRQNSNHPSVAVWGIANEVDFGASLPGFLTGDQGTPPDPLPVLHELNAFAKAEDPTRPTVQANACEGRLFADNVEIPIVAPATDLSGVNRYFGWYYGKISDLGAHLDGVRSSRPAQPIAVSEYGAGGAISMHTDDPTGGRPDSRGRNQPEEYMSYIHEQSWAVFQSRPYLWGTWLWNSFDFATTIRREGDANDINTKGLVTYDRKIRKDAFFFYKANWSDAPTVHINGRRYVDRAYRTTDVRVYSNASNTELTLNGRSLGTKPRGPQGICVWESVKLDEGENVLVASGRFLGGTVQDRIVWTLSRDAVRHVRIDSGALVAAKTEAVRFGSDAFFSGGDVGIIKAPIAAGKLASDAAPSDMARVGVAATYRTGDFRYRLPLENGECRVTLTFVEPTAQPGERLFDVLADDVVMLERLDVAKEAGSQFTKVVRDFRVHVEGGICELHFRAIQGEALVSAVEVSAVD